MSDLHPVFADVFRNMFRDLTPRPAMTIERMREIIQSTPCGGSYSRRMTPDEIAEVNVQWDANPDGSSSFASTLRRMAGLTAWPPYADERDS